MKYKTKLEQSRFMIDNERFCKDADTWVPWDCMPDCRFYAWCNSGDKESDLIKAEANKTIRIDKLSKLLRESTNG